MEIQELFNKEIVREIESLQDMEIGSDEYKVTVDGVTKMADRLIEMERVLQEANEKVADRMMRNGNEFDKRQDEKKDRIIQNCLRGAEIIIPVGLTIWGTITSYKYDEKGIIPSTIIGRGFINKLIPKK